jgi:hypothetical protein
MMSYELQQDDTGDFVGKFDNRISQRHTTYVSTQALKHTCKAERAFQPQMEQAGNKTRDRKGLRFEAQQIKPLNHGAQNRVDN